jgi:hypothetical protein
MPSSLARAINSVYPSLSLMPSQEEPIPRAYHTEGNVLSAELTESEMRVVVYMANVIWH